MPAHCCVFTAPRSTHDAAAVGIAIGSCARLLSFQHGESAAARRRPAVPRWRHGLKKTKKLALAPRLPLLRPNNNNNTIFGDPCDVADCDVPVCSVVPTRGTHPSGVARAMVSSVPFGTLHSAPKHSARRPDRLRLKRRMSERHHNIVALLSPHFLLNQSVHSHLRCSSQFTRSLCQCCACVLRHLTRARAILCSRHLCAGRGKRRGLPRGRAGSC